MCLFFSQLQSLSAVILDSRKIKPVTVFNASPCICHEVMELDVIIFVFFFLSCFVFLISTYHVKPIREKMKCKKVKWSSEQALQITQERRKAKVKREKRHTHVNVEFQGIAIRDF